MTDLFAALRISTSGIDAQTKRLNIISQNIANQSTTSFIPGGTPYIRKTIAFKNILDSESNDGSTELVTVSHYGKDSSAFKIKYNPHHPAADKNGYVKYPNVNEVIELADSKDAQAIYRANLSALSATKNMIMKTLDILANK